MSNRIQWIFRLGYMGLWESRPRPIGRVIAGLAVALAALESSAVGQTGQTAMTPAPGLVNQAAASLSDGNSGLPGWLYYGVNAADRGLGYRGSYMTLGGYVPYAQDDLGGLWAADVRSHLSNYGGFFSNVGAVRKQFIGGTLLGVGVFWDFDGDQNQYSDGGRMWHRYVRPIRTLLQPGGHKR